VDLIADCCVRGILEFICEKVGWNWRDRSDLYTRARIFKICIFPVVLATIFLGLSFQQRSVKPSVTPMKTLMLWLYATGHKYFRSTQNKAAGLL
jgi:hypothetical protein